MTESETFSTAIKRRWDRLFAFFSGARWGYAGALLLVFAAMLAAALQSYRAIDRELTEAALSKNAALAELAAVTLSEKMDRIVDLGVSLADRVRFRELIGVGKWIEAVRILDRVRDDFPFVDRLILTDTDGTLRADIPEVPEVMGRNFSGRDWYKGVSRDRKPYVSAVYRRAAAPVINVFGVAVPIRHRDGKVLGSLVLQVRLETLFEWTRDVDIGPDGYLYVVDRSGRVAFHPRLPLQGDLIDFSAVPAVRLALAGETGVDVAADPGASEEIVSAYGPVRSYGWAVVAAQPARAAFATRNLQLNRLLLAYGLAGLFCILAAYLTSRIVIERRHGEIGRRMKAELERLVVERTAQLGESEERHRAVVDTAIDAIVVIDGRGAIQRFNPGAEGMFGYSEAELVGRNVSLLMPSPYREQHDGYLARFLTTGEKRIIGIGREVIGRRKDGSEFPIHLAVAEMRMGESRMFTGIIRDITEEKRAAAQQAQLVTGLEAANKELESFSYSVSHDLRSPLRAIDGFARILTEDYGDKLDDEGRRLFGVIRNNSRRMGELIDDLLEYSRLGRNSLATAAIDMNRLVGEVLGELPASGGRPPRLDAGVLPPARGDATLVKQVWTNLLTNAIKFSGKREHPVIEVSGHEDGAQCVYCVKDNGAGFDMRYREKLFGVFQRLHSEAEFEGTGVGLAIVQRVVSRHGGRVWAEGKVGEGAAFYFSLPKGASDGPVRES